MAKITDYSPTSSISSADIFYVVQNVGGTNTSKTVSFANLMAVVPTKTAFTNGINYGGTPQELTNSGTISTAGITALILTATGNFTLPNGSQGDEKILITESNVGAHVNTVNGVFANGTTSIDAGATGTMTYLVFHHGIWYKK